MLIDLNTVASYFCTMLQTTLHDCWPCIANCVPHLRSLGEVGWAPKGPQKFWKSHWCVPFTATFSKRRKIGALWSERCDGAHINQAGCEGDLIMQHVVLPRSRHCDVGMHAYVIVTHANICKCMYVHKGSSIMLPRRVCSPQLCAMPVPHARAPEQAREDTSPHKN